MLVGILMVEVKGLEVVNIKQIKFNTKTNLQLKQQNNNMYNKLKIIEPDDYVDFKDIFDVELNKNESDNKL